MRIHLLLLFVMFLAACEGTVDYSPFASDAIPGVDATTASGDGATPGTPGATPVADPGDLDGAALYRTYCAGCHGLEAEGTPTWPSSIQGYAPIETIVRDGRNQMPAIPLAADDVAKIQAFLLTLAPPVETLDGAGLYGRFCASCHGADATGTPTWPTSIQGYAPIEAIVRDGRGDMDPIPVDAAQAAEIQAYLLTLAPPLSELTGPQVYERLCVGCHGERGAGIDTKGMQLRYDDPEFSVYWVRAGRGTSSYDSPMPAYPTEMISTEQLDEMFAWIAETPHPADGEGLYNQYCANCHGVDGRGGPSGHGLAGSDDDFGGVIRNGKGGTGYAQRRSYMTRWSATQLSDGEIAAIRSYVQAL